jgi:selenocysteine-specific elongation factor
MIIGTAGHIDHGKSSLVTALTGAAMDRLAEERRREITIDLNFASLELGGGRIAGVVDVPGHEDFVRTMVAGASGIDLALLVIAADEGIMPQTEEHLAILEQLAIPAAIPVITKQDLVEPEWLQLVMVDIAERLSRSSIPFQAPIAVSARTGEGIEHLRQKLTEHAGTLGSRPTGDVFRLPVDRVFSLPGVGTVITGTAWSGRLKVGSSVVLLPSGLEGRVRSIGSYGRQVEQSEPGARTALGIVGIDRAQVRRGDVVVTADAPWAPTSALDVELALLRSASKPLGSRTRVRVLLGTSEVMGRVLPRSAIKPGESGMARLSLEKPLVGRAQDRFVIRSYSPVSTVGGGRVLDPLPPHRRTVWPQTLGSVDPQECLVSLIARRPNGIPTRMLAILLGIPPAAALAVARKEQTIRLVGEVWVTTTGIERVGSRALALLKEYHRLHPSAVGMPLETLRHSLHAADQIVATALLDFARTGKLRRIDGVVALAGFTPRVTGGDAEIDRVVGILSEAYLTPPSIPELERSTGRRDLVALLRLAAATGRVEAVERDRYYSREALEHFTDVLRDMGEQGAIHPAQVRDRLGISRKYLIPLLEWADGRGITIRQGEGRTLKRGLGSEV